MSRKKKATTTELVLVAKEVAQELAHKNGAVSSTDVLDELRARNYDVDAVEKRFMGAVFRKGFYRDGYENTGSHHRPVSVWRLAPMLTRRSDPLAGHNHSFPA